MRREVSLKNLSKGWEQNDLGFLVELRSITTEEEEEVFATAPTISVPMSRCSRNLWISSRFQFSCRPIEVATIESHLSMTQSR